MVRDVSLMVNIYKNSAGSIQVCLNKTTKATETQFQLYSESNFGRLRFWKFVSYGIFVQK